MKSRTTKDMDLHINESAGSLFDLLLEAASLDLGDWFLFEVERAAEEPDEIFGGFRYPIRCQLDGRVFEQFHVDVGTGDLLTGKWEYLQFPPLLAFAEIPPVSVRCFPISRQIAEKFHALTREYASGSSTRGKDFVDILLLAGFRKIDGAHLSQEIFSTFKQRGTHPVPHSLPSFSRAIRRDYKRLADEPGMRFDNYDSAEEALAAFINPVRNLFLGYSDWGYTSWS